MLKEVKRGNNANNEKKLGVNEYHAVLLREKKEGKGIQHKKGVKSIPMKSSDRASTLNGFPCKEINPCSRSREKKSEFYFVGERQIPPNYAVK